MKKIELNIKDFFDLTGSVIYNPDKLKSINKVVIDSRKIVKGCLFVAIKGEKYDGHNFVEESIKKGASAVLINKKNLNKYENINSPIITVPDTIKAYGELANKWRKKLNAKVIGLTGSAGKTTTKEIISTLLSEKYNVLKTEANNNNHIGVPLTIFNSNEKHEVLVLELGTNHIGEIYYTSKIAEPDIALITNIGSSHLEFLINKNGVLKEKSDLFRITDRMKGIICINNDDKLLNKESKKYKNTITFGLKKGSNVKGKTVSENGNNSLLKIKYKKKEFVSELPLLGEHNISNYLAAVTISLITGLKEKHIINGTKKVNSYKGRLELKVKNNIKIIDDTYNANPESMKAALNVLKNLNNNKKKIAILGDMFELGEKSVEYHSELGKYIKKIKPDSLYTIGKLMKNLHSSLNGAKFEHKHFSNRKSLENFIIKNDFDNSVILFKGSRGMKMEEFLKILIEK